VARRFVESDHPRWPAETPDSKGGEFRDKTPGIGGGDWADRLSGRIGVREPQPAGRHGSVSTGLAEKCPVCGRQVKVVGAGKLSTHNNPDTGQRCTGSGRLALYRPPKDIQRAPTRTKLPPTKKTTRRAAASGLRPPPPPQVTPGRWDEQVTGAAETRMANWRSRTMHRQADGSMYHPNTAATRIAQIQQLHDDIQTEQRNLEGRRNRAMYDAARTALGLRHWEALPPGAEKSYEAAADRQIGQGAVPKPAH